MFHAIVDADLVRRAAPCQSTEETRYYLNGVHIEFRPQGGAYVVATDGTKMIVFFDPKAVVSPNKSAIVKLDKSMIAAATKASSKPLYLVCDETRGAIVEGDATQYKLDAPDPTKTRAFQALGMTVDGSYPDWRRVLPQAPFGPTDAVFQTVHLAALSKALTVSREAAIRVSAHTGKGGVEGPHLVRGEHMNGFGAIMPYRMGLRGATIPGWMADPKIGDDPLSEAAA